MNSSAPETLITLSSDFGTGDGYAAAMKGVIRSVAPHVRLEDLTHEIPPGDIRAGAWMLRTAVPFFPRGTVHVVVVDPGVGTARNALVLQADSQYLIGPDNGVFSWIIREANEIRAWTLSDDSWHPEQSSHTFHGRDLFAHAAALMVQEGELSRVCGEEVSPQCEAWSESYAVTSTAQGEVVHVDRFGNAVCNLFMPDLEEALPGKVSLPGRTLSFDTLSRTYGDVDEGKALLLVGSHGFLEIAIRQGSAAKAFGLQVGDSVYLE
ncbi:SAM-dependent chlorinase/fluorinase [Kiritimatiellaeota bacterium B1221]|nr:SAM-dependent chlorinase/fluorinase [Kiritimatiellaeota bacterium B1221]